jgi:thioredoxin-related protein
MKKLIIILILCGLNSVFAQQKPATAKKEGIEWISLEEAYTRTQKEPRKTLIDAYTDWCGWCKVMDRETYTNPELIEYMNKTYYMVKFNAESKTPVKIGPNTYTFDEKSGAHQAAIALLQGKMSYPTTVFLDEKFNMIQPIPGYMKPKDFHQLVTYLGGNFHTKEPYEQYKTGTYLTTYKNIQAKL